MISTDGVTLVAVDEHTTGWRFPSKGKPTTVGKDIGVETVAVEREISSFDGLVGNIYLHVHNLGTTAQDRVELTCDLVGASGQVVAKGLSGAVMPTVVNGTRRIPGLPPKERRQIMMSQKLATEADKQAWAQKGLTARCAARKD